MNSPKTTTLLPTCR